MRAQQTLPLETQAACRQTSEPASEPAGQQARWQG